MLIEGFTAYAIMEKRFQNEFVFFCNVFLNFSFYAFYEFRLLSRIYGALSIYCKSDYSHVRQPKLRNLVQL